MSEDRPYNSTHGSSLRFCACIPINVHLTPYTTRCVVAASSFDPLPSADAGHTGWLVVTAVATVSLQLLLVKEMNRVYDLNVVLDC